MVGPARAGRTGSRRRRDGRPDGHQALARRRRNGRRLRHRHRPRADRAARGPIGRPGHRYGLPGDPPGRVRGTGRFRARRDDTAGRRGRAARSAERRRRAEQGRDRAGGRPELIRCPRRPGHLADVDRGSAGRRLLRLLRWDRRLGRGRQLRRHAAGGGPVHRLPGGPAGCRPECVLRARSVPPRPVARRIRTLARDGRRGARGKRPSVRDGGGCGRRRGSDRLPRQSGRGRCRDAVPARRTRRRRTLGASPGAPRAGAVGQPPVFRPALLASALRLAPGELCRGRRRRSGSRCSRRWETHRRGSLRSQPRCRVRGRRGSQRSSSPSCSCHHSCCEREKRRSSGGRRTCSHRSTSPSDLLVTPYLTRWARARWATCDSAVTKGSEIRVTQTARTRSARGWARASVDRAGRLQGSTRTTLKANVQASIQNATVVQTGVATSGPATANGGAATGGAGTGGSGGYVNTGNDGTSQSQSPRRAPARPPRVVSRAVTRARSVTTVARSPTTTRPGSTSMPRTRPTAMSIRTPTVATPAR